MGLKSGYKQTEMGVIPDEWEVKTCAEICLKIQDGTHFSPTPGGKDFLYVTSKNIGFGTLDVTDANRIDAAQHRTIYKRCDVRRGDLLLTKDGANTGNAALNTLDEEFSLLSSVALLRLDTKKHEPSFYLQQVLSGPGQRRIKDAMSGNAITRLTLVKIRGLRFPAAPFPEQCVIAQALGDVDAQVAAQEKLITKKRDLKQAAMQQLLTGRTRMPGFKGMWEVKRIAEIATPSPERNAAAEVLPVLTCSKHRGFVDSLGYFKNQVFSEDTSTYRLIRRGQIGYPANHVEEGSIGLQDLYDMALVSPIYVVFSVNESVDSYFLHRVLKLDSYRQRFKTATTSSVDRRGSLRWPAFSEITVSIPSLPEQVAIAAALSDMDAEIAALDARLAKTRDLKQGMMQELLTGRTRLVGRGAA